ncbi:MAG: hypothetical protein JWN25_1201 [Verrucomicrobiales bacterium]|nr:hypothetical protein [Verrucomicrobiales bacterium]
MKHSPVKVFRGTHENISPRNLWIGLGCIVLPILGFISELIENVLRGFGPFPQRFYPQNTWSSVEYGLLQATFFYSAISLLVYFFVGGKLGWIVQAVSSRHAQWRRWLILYCVVVGILDISGSFNVEPRISTRIFHGPIIFTLWPLLLVIGLSKLVEMKGSRAALADSLWQIDSEGQENPSSPKAISSPQTSPAFNLNSELASWRASMLRCDSMSRDCVKELENHVIESIEDLKSKGFTEEASFKMAIRSIGNQEKLAAEFAIDEAASIWKKRAFWLGMGWLSISILPIVALEKFLFTFFDGAFFLWDHFVHNYAPDLLGNSQALHGWMYTSGISIFLCNELMPGLFIAGILFGKLDRFIDWISKHSRIFLILALALFFAEAALSWRAYLWDPRVTPSFSEWQKHTYYLHLGIVTMWKLGLVLLLTFSQMKRLMKSETPFV